MTEATKTIIAAHVSSDTTRRALFAASRLLRLNGREYAAEELEVLNGLGKHLREQEKEGKSA